MFGDKTFVRWETDSLFAATLTANCEKLRKKMAQQCIISPNLEWENKNLEISDIKMRNAGNSGFVFLNCILLCPPKKSKFRHSILADAELSFTFWTDLANFLHIVLGAIVDGMRDPTLTDGLMFAC